MAKQIILKHYQRILTQWPIDLLRPTVSFQNAIQHRIDTRLNSSSQSSSSLSTPPIPSVPGQATPSATATNASPPQSSAQDTFDERSELEQVNVLYSFLENRYSKKYPLPESVMRPASQPEYYEKLVRELEAAPKRSWWETRVNRWRGMVRWT